DVRKHAPLAADTRLDRPIPVTFPAALPPRLVFPILGITNTRLGFDIVEPCVFHTLAAGPHVLAGHAAGVTPDALVEVQHHRDLSADLHSAASRLPLPACSATGRSSQSTFDILRTMTNSSRLAPTVP